MTDTLKQFAYYNFPIWYILQGQEDPDEFLIKLDQWYSGLTFDQAKEIIEWIKKPFLFPDWYDWHDGKKFTEQQYTAIGCLADGAVFKPEKNFHLLFKSLLSDPKTRELGLLGFVYLNDPRGVPFVLPFIDEEDEEIVSSLNEALEAMPGQESLSALMKLYEKWKNHSGLEKEISYSTETVKTAIENIKDYPSYYDWLKTQ